MSQTMQIISIILIGFIVVSLLSHILNIRDIH